MAILAKKKQYTKKPSNLDLEIDWENTDTEGLIGFWVCNDNDYKTLRDITGNHDATISGAASVRKDAASFDGLTGIASAPYSPELQPANLTIIARIKRNDLVTNSNAFVMPFNNIASPSYISYSIKTYEDATRGALYEFGISGGITKLSVDAYIKTGTYSIWSITHNNADTVVDIDGTHRQSSSSGAVVYSGTDSLNFGAAKSGNNHANCDIDYVLLFDRAKNNAEKRRIELNPWALVKPQKRYISLAADTTAPVISNATGSATGSTTATGAFDTNETAGTGYAWATTNATEVDTDIISSGNSATVTATTTTITHSGLTASTTYYIHYVQNDAAGNTSNVISSASFTTDAASTFQAAWATRARASSMIGAR